MPLATHPHRRPSSFLALIAALGLVAFGGHVAAAGTAPADTTAIEWSVVPADADGPDGRVSLRHVADPGATVTDHIAVTNLGSSTTEFLVAAGDGVIGADGAFDVASGEPADSGSWIRVDGVEDGRITLDAGETRVLPLTIEVPSRATPGDHPAGIVVGVPMASDGVTVTHRIGVRLHLQVAGEIAPQLSIQAVEASFTPSLVPFAPGTLAVAYEVENAGNVRLGAASRVGVAGPFGLSPAESANPIVELLPGDVTRQQVEVEAWPLMMLLGQLEVVPSSIGDDRTSLPGSVSAEFGSAALTWTGLALLGLLALAVVVRRRSRRTVRRSPSPAPALSSASPARQE